MLQFTVLDNFNFETTSCKLDEEYAEGNVCVKPYPPQCLEEPKCPDEILTYDLFLVDCCKMPNGMNWDCIRGCRVYWNNINWKIIDLLPIENGESCIVCILNSEL